MSGHSKWHKVKNQKAANDPKRSRLFTQLTKKIQIASKESGPDPDVNPSLRSAIEEARAANLPKDKIERAINKGAGIGDEGALKDVQYEGYGPSGVAVLIQASTDNINRTVSEIRKIFKDAGGSLGEPGSAAFVFGDDPHNPTFTSPIRGADTSVFETMIDELESHDDVVRVFHNAG
ncbi:YebC/PmpR family DNA-binding transcriptional regulator [bacterium]|uniref:YebC/PmpR family DNA-binding transcriptional regulator n=2 Tax=Katanobacteria TaxID=422282 RepID=A0A2M7X2X8_UNCKA|nr:YebC/PmpR family DNA-binding transcriptional regulator [bacterium]PIP56452.1 MAG: YebC/PmpR family DNA-binding transcriptional regulator [candidate division WWE3 bacterium CG22_combo_CG10-13_8_21_14_all_39_12]PJA40469.1 MAG: YebC/PmpR family DNA-binding transcriptional regulator [candidate division WWE3 bacterium CG_4_9_14_3_um_filter_39_7]